MKYGSVGLLGFKTINNQSKQHWQNISICFKDIQNKIRIVKLTKHLIEVSILQYERFS